MTEKIGKVTDEDINDIKDQVIDKKEEVPEPAQIPNIHCQHCGVNLDIPALEITDDDKDLWVRHILSNGAIRFEKTYSLYSGKINVVLSSRTAVEERDIDCGVGTILNDVKTVADLTRLKVEQHRLQLLYSLRLIDFAGGPDSSNEKKTFAPPEPSEITAKWKTGDSYCSEAYIDFYSTDLPTALTTILLDKIVDFNAICAGLLLQSSSPDF